MNNRDPKRNPHPGDSLRKGLVLRTVTVNDAGWVDYIVSRKAVRDSQGRSSLTLWKRWAKGADVVARGI